MWIILLLKTCTCFHRFWVCCYMHLSLLFIFIILPLHNQFSWFSIFSLYSFMYNTFVHPYDWLNIFSYLPTFLSLASPLSLQATSKRIISLIITLAPGPRLTSLLWMWAWEITQRSSQSHLRYCNGWLRLRGMRQNNKKVRNRK